jgi:hypothetical protein
LSFALGSIIFVISLVAVIAIAWTMRLLLVEGTPGPAEALRRWSGMAWRTWDKLRGQPRFDEKPEEIEPTVETSLSDLEIDQTGISPSPATAQPLTEKALAWIGEMARRALDAPAFANVPSSTPWQDDPNIRRWTVLALAVGTATIVVVLLWLAPGGSLYQGLESDYRFVPRFLTAGLGMCVLFLGSALTKLWWRNRLGRMVEYTSFGAGISVLAWLAISILPTVYVLLDSQGRLEFQESVHADLVALLALRWPISLLPVGLGLLLSARHPLRRWHNGLGSSAVSASASIYAGGITMWALNILGESVTVVAGLGVVALTVSISLALAMLASHGVGASNVVVAGVSRWADQSRLRVVNVGFLVGVYAAFLRPLIFGSLNYSLIWEWLLGTSVIIGFALLTGGQINKLRHASERNQEWKEWRTHQVKEAVDLPHESMERLVLAQKAFVEIGVKEDLITDLVSFLHENRVPASDIIEMVEPIVNHQDRPVSRLAIWGARRRIRERNAAARRVLLRDWTEIIQDLVPQLSRGYVIRETHIPTQSDTEDEGAVTATSA